jgi:hypothetical protein
MPKMMQRDRAYRDSTSTEVDDKLLEVQDLCRSIGGSLDDDDQAAAAEVWASIAKDIGAVMERVRKAAR